MINLQDEDLSLSEKIELISNIERLQNERWRRMKFFHDSSLLLDMSARHFLMQKLIDLMREQRERLIKLKQSVYA